MAIDQDLRAAIAVTRFGLGARPGEIDIARADPEGYLNSQIRPQGADTPGEIHATALERLNERQVRRRDNLANKLAHQGPSAATMQASRTYRQGVQADLLARMQLGARTPAGFRERWTLFWANHFTVSAAKKKLESFVVPFEDEAIRPRVFGRFEDLLIASSRHPAMLFYLNQTGSIGPGSPEAKLRNASGKAAGLNENLAREILELHSVGLEAGYSQADVTEFARAMTGWRFGETDAQDDGFWFDADAHEPGARTIMGRWYAQGGEDQARSVMKDLAASPHTARLLIGMEV